jgi:hypothetical protein
MTSSGYCALTQLKLGPVGSARAAGGITNDSETSMIIPTFNILFSVFDAGLHRDAAHAERRFTPDAFDLFSRRARNLFDNRRKRTQASKTEKYLVKMSVSVISD